MEEAEELCDAKTPQDVAFEAADLIYFALTKAIGAGATLADIEANLDAKSLKAALAEKPAEGAPASISEIPDAILKIVTPIIDDVRKNGDKALLSYTHKFEKATSLTSPVIKAPFPQEFMKLDPETIKAIDTSYENIKKSTLLKRR
ncbi:trifunctional histidinol dehydrogenase [Metarhizium acridum]|nr:trifunctional histidinol dehydrogenase [Metarhizium acridum]